MRAYIRLAKYLIYLKKEAGIKILIGLGIVLCGYGKAFCLAGGISGVFAQKSEIVLKYAGGVLVMIVLQSYLIRYQEGFAKEMAAKIKGVIRSRVLDKLMLLGPGYLNQKRSGAIQSFLTDGVESMETYLVNYLPQIGVVMISVTAVILFICHLDPMVGLLILVMAILAIFLPHVTKPIMAGNMVLFWKTYATLDAQYLDAMNGMSTLKAFCANRRIGKTLEEDVTTFAKRSTYNTGISLLDSSMIVACMAVGTSVSVLFSVWHVSQGKIEVSALLIILFLTGECMKPLQDLNQYWHGSYLGSSVADELYEILDAPEPLLVEEKENQEVNFIHSNNEALIQVEHISFSYVNRNKAVLQNIQFQMKPGEKVALVGKSGGGKSTMVQLLLRFYDVSSGCIRIGGRDIREIPLEQYRSKIAVVFQNPYLFYGTIEENIRMARPNATAQEIIEAAKSANAHDFIKALPDGYQTHVGERGDTLSGGERQRIAIARAVLKDAPILLLDEATSSVDIAGEQEIMEALERVMKGRTTLMIAHRLSTIKNADKILIMENGKICGEGPHEQLLNENNLYAELIQAQERAVASL